MRSAHVERCKNNSEDPQCVQLQQETTFQTQKQRSLLSAVILWVAQLTSAYIPQLRPERVSLNHASPLNLRINRELRSLTECFTTGLKAELTTHHTCHRPTRQGETSSDLANKRSINGAVKRVTHASQNLLRSNSPLQLPLHWSDPWAARHTHWPEDSRSVGKLEDSFSTRSSENIGIL
ncbi:uncharacterized protein V6R79_021163 [Siganus canaliculatus]